MTASVPVPRDVLMQAIAEALVLVPEVKALPAVRKWWQASLPLENQNV